MTHDERAFESLYQHIGAAHIAVADAVRAVAKDDPVRRRLEFVLEALDTANVRLDQAGGEADLGQLPLDALTHAAWALVFNLIEAGADKPGTYWHQNLWGLVALLERRGLNCDPAAAYAALEVALDPHPRGG